MQKKRVLITGINGFIGTQLSNRLTELGFAVYGFTRLKHESKNNIQIDILDYIKVDEFIKKKKINICIHLAGESVVEKGQTDPYNTFKVNIEGTLNILESARKNKLEKIIIASTSHVYGRNKVPYYEGYTPRPSRPYETSKACVDLIAQSYADTFNLPVLIPRFVNIYGPGDLNYERLIPKTILSVINNKPPEMWGGTAVRDFLFIEDAIDAYVSLINIDIEKVGKNRIFNFGTGNLISVKDLVGMIMDVTKSNLSVKHIDLLREDEIKSQYVAISKARNILKWNAKIGLKAGLKKSITWYLAELKNNGK